MKKKKQIILFSVVFAMVILMIISFVLITMNVKSSKSTDLLFEAIENNDVQAAKEAIENGADLKSVQELLGHENLNTTEIYTHVSNDRLRSEYLKYHPTNSP